MTNKTAPEPQVAARDRAERAWLTMITGVTTVAAVAGAVGLATGTVDLGDTVVSRLPWHSEPFAALALAVVVAVPMGAAAFLSGQDRPHQGTVSLAAGALLVGWIGVEAAVIRTFSWLQVVFVVVGLVVLVLGRRRRARHVKMIWPPAANS